jgi:hypothetical protein
MISIKECLEIMHSGAHFSLKVVQYDQRRKEKRGKVLEIASGELVWGDGCNDKAQRQSERQPTDLEKALMGGNEITGRNPNHAHHYTRNVRVLLDGMKTESIHKIHPSLIIEFNGQTTTA